MFHCLFGKVSPASKVSVWDVSQISKGHEQSSLVEFLLFNFKSYPKWFGSLGVGFKGEAWFCFDSKQKPNFCSILVEQILNFKFVSKYCKLGSCLVGQVEV